MKKLLLKIARCIMRKIIKGDRELYFAYKSNIAMCVYDNRNKYGRYNLDGCNDVADKIIDKMLEEL